MARRGTNSLHPQQVLPLDMRKGGGAEAPGRGNYNSILHPSLSSHCSSLNKTKENREHSLNTGKRGTVNVILYNPLKGTVDVILYNPIKGTVNLILYNPLKGTYSKPNLIQPS